MSERKTWSGTSLCKAQNDPAGTHRHSGVFCARKATKDGWCWQHHPDRKCVFKQRKP